MTSSNSTSSIESILSKQLLKVGEISEKLTFRLLEVEEKLYHLEKLQRELNSNTKKITSEALKLTEDKLCNMNRKLDQISRENATVKSNLQEANLSTNSSNSTDSTISAFVAEDSNFDKESIIETEYIDDPQMPMTSS
tara:strand:- start:2554 stop:2967 length:414 start_codon:yes stop_codon:yes gene_type:complete